MKSKKVNVKEFARRLNDRADELGESASTVASKLKLDLKRVEHWFNGRNLPRPEIMPGLAAVLQTRVGWLKRGTTQNNSTQQAQGAPPGREIWPRPIGDYAQKYITGKKCLFQNEEMAKQVIQDLAYLEKVDPLSYDYFVEQIVGKAWRLRIKKKETVRH